MCSATEPWVLQTCRNSITLTSHPSALTEHHRAPGSPEAESLPIVPITSSDTEWICGRTEVLSHRSRQHRTGGRLACAPCAPACAGLLTQAPHLLVCTSASGAPSDGSCWEDGAGTSQPAPSLNPIVLFTPQTTCTSLAHAGLAQLLRYQFPPSTTIPARWGCSLATAALECFISTPCSSSLFPLLTSLGQTTVLQFCLSSTGEASEETCNSLSRRLLLHLALSSGRRYPMNRSGKAKGAQRVLSSGFEQAAAHSWI